MLRTRPIEIGEPVSPLAPAPERIRIDLEQLRRLDDPPADPTPPPKPKKEPTPVPQPQPQPEPQTEPGPWRTDPKTCTVTRDPKASQALKTQACIAWNVAQAMTEAYNLGYADGRRASKNFKTRCTNAKSAARWLNQRLKRIILSQDNPQIYKRRVTSRKR